MISAPDLNKSIVLAFNSAFERGDLNECRRLLSPDVRVFHTGVPGALNREQILLFSQGFLDAFSNHVIRFSHQVVEDDWVASWGSYSAIHTGDRARYRGPIVLARPRRQCRDRRTSCGLRFDGPDATARRDPSPVASAPSI